MTYYELQISNLKTSRKRQHVHLIWNHLIHSYAISSVSAYNGTHTPSWNKHNTITFTDCNISTTQSYLHNVWSMYMWLACLSHYRPDCCIQISNFAQITEHPYKKSPSTYISHFNIETTYSKRRHLDFSSQLFYIILLSDSTDALISLMFQSYKSKHLYLSAMTAKLIAFSYLFDAAFTGHLNINTNQSQFKPSTFYRQ